MPRLLSLALLVQLVDLPHDVSGSPDMDAKIIYRVVIYSFSFFILSSRSIPTSD